MPIMPSARERRTPRCSTQTLINELTVRQDQIRAHRHDRCAARRLVVSPVQRRFLGLMADLDPKGEGDKSMPGKQWPCPGVRGGALRDPRNMARAGLPKAKSPDDASRHPPARRPKPVPCPALVFRMSRRSLRGTGRCPVRAFKEMSWPPTFCSIRTTGTNAGSPTGRESYGDGGLVVVAGVTPRRGGRESRPQGEGGQVIGHHDSGRYA
jgi:hypothetical protein